VTAQDAVSLEGAMTKSTKTSSPKPRALGDAELVLLTSGGQHAEHVIKFSETMKAVTRQRAAANLLKRGLAEERPARPEDPIWREDDRGRFTLAVTAAGLASMGIEEGDGSEGKVGMERGAASSSLKDRNAPRDGTKSALLVSMLSRSSGATVDELIASTGWLPHTTRAALTGLRKRGFEILRERIDDGPSRYRIAAADLTPTAGGRRGRKSRNADVVAPI
jgi:hypothetical protein